ncbi:ATP-binding protein [Georgenia sp. 311]|uniref:GTPase n=1 Tax=Georgenia sp. 311 TaxID=2585134 RepID=UPI00111211AB|nr:GTPase [Georgenia sp. 311]TNC17650.1 ATP-binding protein [Georgenia sp. 311]
MSQTATRRHGAHVAPVTDDDARLTARVQVIAEALEIAGDQVDPALVEASLADIARVEERLRLGVGWTVAALVGGTGSGKSSLFNAISGLSFADVGAIRPTTDRAAACVWGGQATELLDFLSVGPHRRIERESMLDADHERVLHGLVLLDMPDHDSVAEAHAGQVDRLLPLVDLLVWVVDPQKYADNVLHARYLRGLADRQAAMLVLVNQVDTIPRAAVPRVVDSVRSLLRADGLDDVEVLTTSASTGEGVDDVREVLARTVAGHSAAARTAEAEVEAVARRLAVAVGPGEPPAGEAQVAAATDELTRAAGTDAVAESLRSAATRVRPSAPARPELPAAGTVEAVRGRWLASVTDGLPARWRQAVESDVSPSKDLRAAVGKAVGSVPLPEARQPGAIALHVAGLVLAVLGVVGLVLGLTGVLGTDLPGGLLLGVGGGLVALGVGAVVGSRLWRGSHGERVAAGYREDVTARVRDVVRTALAEPTSSVLARHRTLREAVAGTAPQRG